MKRTETETNTNQFTTVKTGYARIAVLLLAINFCLTGYVLYSMNNTMQTQIDSVTGSVTGSVTDTVQPRLSPAGEAKGEDKAE
jgi:uncharacterized transporter YbjL